MSTSEPGPTTLDFKNAYPKVLGYLNFSNGKPDVPFLGLLNYIATQVGFEQDWTALRQRLVAELAQLHSSSATFSDASQAEAVIALVFEHVLPGYRTHHADLLFHLTDRDFLNPLFLGRVFEATLAQGAPWDETERVVTGALDQLNDFLGYRPVAVLENGRKMTPYPYERTRPLPIYIAGAGSCAGRFQAIIDQALVLLKAAPAEVQATARLDVEKLDEIAVDVRAYDHDHPTFKRTNYLFGEWDPHVIDTKGFYRRFVIRMIILDALTHWVSRQSDKVEAVFDAAAVLCGTMLMASAISGEGPNYHDSTVSLTVLLPKVARQRDDFYARLMQSLKGPRAKRVERESNRTQQPFGHVRQSLNLHLAHYGARQVQHRHLANAFAKMGHAAAARQEAAVIPCASARFDSEIQWRITTSKHLIVRGQVKEAAPLLREIEDLLHHGIRCGALVDPWNILGFGGNFPLFAAREDSIPDHRVEVLLDLMERIFGIFSQALTEAAAQGENAVVEDVRSCFERLADYWDQFASYVIDDLPKVRGRESLESATQVSAALVEWRAAGEAAGNISFWRKHVESFSSPKAYACVVEVLLAKGDYVAAMALLVQWLSCADVIGIESGPYSIHALLIDWMNRLTTGSDKHTRLPVDWASIRRLFDYLEVNAGEYWDVPTLESFGGSAPKSRKGGDQNDWDSPEVAGGQDSDDDDDDIFGAAYDGFSFKDSADDGTDGDVADSGGPMGNTEFELLNRQLEPRIKFVMALAQLWQVSASSLAVEHFGTGGTEAKPLSDDRIEAVTGWWRRVRVLQRDLLQLMESIEAHGIDEPAGDHDGNVEFDIQLQTKFYLLNTILATHINCRIAETGLLCLLPSVSESAEVSEDDRQMVDFYRAVMSQDVPEVQRLLKTQFQRLARKPLLYVPLDNGGEPNQILVARTVQADLRFLLKQLPKLGLFRETWHVVRLAHRMERETRPSQMAVTEFDRIFRTGLRNTMECLLQSVETWKGGKFSDDDLIAVIGELVSQYSDQWLRHSQTMRLSAVEGLRQDIIWDDIKAFIIKFGTELFHPKSLTLGNIRVILHNGVDWYLEQLAQQEDPLQPNKLLAAIEDGEIDQDAAVEFIELIYSSVVDKFDRFLEYNTTTTQSDYGDKFYVLLDFMKLEAAYDRQAWERIPESIAHRSLALSSRTEALKILEDLLEADSRNHADKHVAALRLLESKHGVHLPTISDRLNERFVKPLAVNRMLALVEPAMQPGPAGLAKFERLRAEVQSYMQDQTGSAIDVPQWLQDIEREVARQESPTDYLKPPELEVRLPVSIVSEAEVREQLAIWGQSVTGSGSEAPKKKSGTRRRRRRDAE